MPVAPADALRMTLGVAPNVVVRTTRPVAARGLVGRRDASAFAFFVDAPGSLAEALDHLH